MVDCYLEALEQEESFSPTTCNPQSVICTASKTELTFGDCDGEESQIMKVEAEEDDSTNSSGLSILLILRFFRKWGLFQVRITD